MMETIRIALADNQLLFRQSISFFIGAVEGFELLFEADNGVEFMDALERSGHKPHIALLDVEMPVMDGLELQSKLHHSYPELKTIMLSVHNNERLIARFIQNGANGYLQKNCDKTELIDAIRTTHEKGFYMNESVMKALQNIGRNKPSKRLDGVDISARERDVLCLICKEYSTQEIAEKLFLSPRTVEGHRNNLLLKTGCRNTAGLVLFAIRNQICDTY